MANNKHELPIMTLSKAIQYTFSRPETALLTMCFIVMTTLAFVSPTVEAITFAAIIDAVSLIVIGASVYIGCRGKA